MLHASCFKLDAIIIISSPHHILSSSSSSSSPWFSLKQSSFRWGIPQLIIVNSQPRADHWLLQEPWSKYLKRLNQVTGGTAPRLRSQLGIWWRTNGFGRTFAEKTHITSWHTRVYSPGWMLTPVFWVNWGSVSFNRVTTAPNQCMCSSYSSGVDRLYCFSAGSRILENVYLRPRKMMP
jgi:hypothetical protein